MKRLKIILPSAALFCTLITFVSIVFSWYIVSTTTSDMNFTILQIDSLVTLYEADDQNFNGVPDLLPSDNLNQYKNNSTWVGYSNRYYSEKYEFDYLDQRYALSADSSSNLFNEITITDAAPSKIYTYKFEISNYVSAQNALTFEFINDSESSSKLSTLKDFQVRLGYLESTGSTTSPTITYGDADWLDFTDGTSYSGITLNSSLSMNVPSYSSDAGRRDIWLQIRINPEAETQFEGSFTLPMYKITLDASGSASTATIRLKNSSVTSYEEGTDLTSVIAAYDGANELNGTYAFTLNGEAVTTVAEGTNTYSITFTPSSSYGDKYSAVTTTVSITGTSGE